MVDGGTGPPTRRRKRSRHESAEDWISEALIRPFTDVAVKALDAAGEGAVHAMEMLIEPKKSFEKGLSGSVNLRPIEDAYKLGNRFGLAPVVLPIGIENPIERIYEIRLRMGQMKGRMQPLLAFGLLAVAGLLVKPAQDAMLSLFSKKTTAVMTNVSGPSQKIKFCGSTLEQNLFLVPQSGTVGLGVSILS